MACAADVQELYGLIKKSICLLFSNKCLIHITSCLNILPDSWKNVNSYEINHTKKCNILEKSMKAWRSTINPTSKHTINVSGTYKMKEWDCIIQISHQSQNVECNFWTCNSYVFIVTTVISVCIVKIYWVCKGSGFYLLIQVLGITQNRDAYQSIDPQNQSGSSAEAGKPGPPSY